MIDIANTPVVAIDVPHHLTLWAHVLITLALLLVVVVSVVLAVEIAMKRRQSEFKAMFDRALQHGMSIDGLANSLRTRDQELADELHALAKEFHELQAELLAYKEANRR